MTRRMTAALCLALPLAIGCSSALSDAEARQHRQRLRDAIGTSVDSRAERDEQSRLLADIVATGALDGLNQSELRAALGTGQACRTELCDAQGFAASDWFYEIGRAGSPDVKQVPVLIVGFDARGRVVRVFALTTH
jgi:hypothetical protein